MYSYDILQKKLSAISEIAAAANKAGPDVLNAIRETVQTMIENTLLDMEVSHVWEMLKWTKGELYKEVEEFYMSERCGTRTYLLLVDEDFAFLSPVFYEDGREIEIYRAVTIGNIVHVSRYKDAKIPAGDDILEVRCSNFNKAAEEICLRTNFDDEDIANHKLRVAMVLRLP